MRPPIDVAPGWELQKHYAHKAWRAADRIRRLSDRLVGIGPFGLGLDGVLAWVPGVGSFYSVAAGGLLVYFGLRARAQPGTLARMVAYIAANTGASTVPVVGWAADTLFPGHLMAARALQKDIEARHGPPPEIAARRHGKRPMRRRLRKRPAPPPGETG
jgi:hypothetical protein